MKGDVTHYNEVALRGAIRYYNKEFRRISDTGKDVLLLKEEYKYEEDPGITLTIEFVPSKQDLFCTKFAYKDNVVREQTDELCFRTLLFEVFLCGIGSANIKANVSGTNTIL